MGGREISMKKTILISVLSFFAFTSLIAPVVNATETYLNQSKNQVTGVSTDKDLRVNSHAQSGGWWRYGKKGKRNISEYTHYSKEGHASCENGNGTFNSGKWVAKDEWSKSSVGWTLWGNKSYYNYR